MVEFLAYDLKVAVLIAVFYMFYRLLLSRETFHSVNRVMLLLTAITSYVLPLCVITMHKTVVVEATESAINFGGLSMMVEEAPQMPLWQLLAVVIFLLGAVRLRMLFAATDEQPHAEYIRKRIAQRDYDT